GFVDPDDWLERTMFEELVGAAVRERADIVMCGYIREFGTHSRVKKFDLPHAAVSRGEEIQSRWMRRLVGPLREELAQPDYLDAWGTVWNKLYRSAMLKDKALKFIDLHIVGRNEDTLFNIHAFSHAEAFVFINRPLYHYWRVNSASITSLYNPLLVEKFEQQYRLMETFIDEHRLPSEFRAALSNRICMNIVGLGLHIISAGNPASLPGKIRSLRRLVARPRFREALKGLELAYCAAPWRIFFTCARLKLPLSLYIMLKAMNAMRTRSKGGMSSETGSNSAGGDRDESGRTGNDDHELLQANGSQ
ncbi:hypothetical protein K0U00_38335, partial [Paenibacillus sepulcri]|nr:hypothetical protein [Paenibacillus sepulcri]